LNGIFSPSLRAWTKASYCALSSGQLIPGDVHVDALAVDDRSDGIEEGEGAFPRFGRDRLGEFRAGQRTRGDDRWVVGQGIDALAHDADVRVLLDRPGDLSRERFTVHRERRSGRHAVRIGGAHDQRAQRAHLLVEKPDGIVLGVVAAEAVRADHFGEAVALMRRGHVAAAAHFAQANGQARFGQLPRRFRSGQAAADDLDVV
jgi:hypothetical protein